MKNLFLLFIAATFNCIESRADIFHQGARDIRMIMVRAGMTTNGIDHGYYAINLVCRPRAKGQPAVCTMKDVFSAPGLPSQMKTVMVDGIDAMTLAKTIRSEFPYSVQRDGSLKLRDFYCAYWSDARQNFCRDSY